jgi:NADPH:quinone reductase-like Zn-dependent oxidoreductase
MGAYGEYLSLPASRTIVQQPSKLSFEEATAVPLGGLNALHYMRLANIPSGERVLINGAGRVRCPNRTGQRPGRSISPTC